MWDGAHRGNLTGLTDELAACVARTDLDSTVVHANQLSLLAALVEPVGAENPVTPYDLGILADQTCGENAGLPADEHRCLA